MYFNLQRYFQETKFWNASNINIKIWHIFIVLMQRKFLKLFLKIILFYLTSSVFVKIVNSFAMKTWSELLSTIGSDYYIHWKVRFWKNDILLSIELLIIQIQIIVNKVSIKAIHMFRLSIVTVYYHVQIKRTNYWMDKIEY